MHNYARAVDFTQTYQESFEKLFECLEAIHQESEYNEFIQAYKE